MKGVFLFKENLMKKQQIYNKKTHILQQIKAEMWINQNVPYPYYYFGFYKPKERGIRT